MKIICYTIDRCLRIDLKHKTRKMPERRRMMGSKLSHKLIDLGSFSALGTSEHSPGLTEKEVHVEHGTPNTFDSNNGIIVVYDENGRPWIIRSDCGDKVVEDFWKAINEHNLKCGAYVPHSNDGGYFVREVIPKL